MKCGKALNKQKLFNASPFVFVNSRSGLGMAFTVASLKNVKNFSNQ